MIARIVYKDEVDCSICKLQDTVKENSNIKRCGAIYSFEGIVRGLEPSKVTRKMVLSTPDKDKCEKELEEIITDIIDKTGVIDVAVVHYLGEFEIGDSLFLAVVAGPHRQETQKALNEVVERVKYELDFKKEEFTEDGTNIIMSGG
ncbi:MAG TPA: molybdenum cofactor biosynthesis protein MoaE [Methanobacterium sp.]|nr:molybdenum cofactor biosynthesis protein MoaE [Methanobacterium sp.]